ncbi:MAG: DEAD/DEAH box helicase, partial [Lachnospiraceae bacterium]|nr:DEAD/DEAH box helicase [Lachnospiraceae bacterium]
DEADRMLDMGFLPDMKRIIAMTPETRQTVMFSATMEKKVEALAREMLTDPERIQVAAQNNAADTVEQRLIFTEREMKDEVVINLLQEQLEKDDENALSRKDRTNAIVFTRTKRGAERLNRVLNHAGIGAAAINGDKTQGQRKDALDRFRAGRTQVLVATDVAARGIDVPSLSYVFNYDLPEEAENYVHRIGRTGRAGEEGIAITLCDKEELELLEAIEYLIKKEIPVVETEWSIHLERIPHRGQGSNGRRRYHKPEGQNGQNGSRENRQSSQRRNHYRSNGGQNKGYRKPRHMSHREKTRHMSENKSARES